MEGPAIFLLIVVGFIVIAIQAALLWKSVSLVGGERLRERNSFMTAFLLIILFGVIGFGLGALIHLHVMPRSWAFGASLGSVILAMMLSYGIGPLHALLILLVNGMIAFALAFFLSLFGTFIHLGRVFGPGGVLGGAGQ